MTIDQLQKYILSINTKVRAMKLPNTTENKAFNSAISEVSSMLDTEREVVLNSYKELKDRGAV